ncbi:hypothetical protein SAMN04489859_103149 [Paracoccus alcaliphilus]|uniref:Uncharacterized protein n=1 Tax=Paracoccus alcaliphilus TaxID=34002 RepID=A0A1H8LK51_9RHOB|nr:hypothetical protein SAMN04489859_103149 [Paracoccus alcaliphilus]
MSIRAVLLFLLIMIAIAIAAGPGFRRFMARMLGISRRDR